MSDLDEKSMMLGGHAARLDAVEKRLASIESAVEQIRDILAQSKGSVRMIVGFATLAAALTEGAHWLWSLMHGGHGP